MSAKIDALTQQIAQKLRIVSAHTLQALSEDMALLACEHRFKGRPLIRQGRNPDAQTTKGWPDAYVFTSTNTVDGIEATRDRQSWTKHLTEDLEKAKDSKNYNLSGYFFVGGYPDNEPSAKEIKSWTDKFAGLGIEASNIQILIGKHLAFELAKPEYARIRQLHLGIHSSTIYFEGIRESILMQRSDSLAQPSEQDFELNRVFKPSIADSVLQELSLKNPCLVRGHGASGKTTLAYWVGLSEQYKAFPVYLLDIANLSEESSLGGLKNEMTEQSGQGVLFIIDNIHIDENSAESILNHWNRFSRPLGSHLLLLGREIGSSDGSPLGSIKPIVLRAGKHELRSIVLCKLGADTFIPENAINDWVRTFGGRGLRRSQGRVAIDLIAFSAAIERRRTQIQSGNWQLTPSDAVDAVRERYLQPMVSSESRANLLRLAALSEYEFRVPRIALPFPSVGFTKECLALGLVMVSKGRFSLAHAALGPLLLEAEIGFDATAERLNVARHFPYFGTGMLQRNIHPEERDLVRSVLIDTLAEANWLDYCSNLHDVANVIDAATRSLRIQGSILDEQINAQPRLMDLIIATRSLGTLTSQAGRFSARGLHRAAEATLGWSNPRQWVALQRNILSAQAGEVLAFLKNVKRPHELMSKINIEEWNSSCAAVAIDRASKTCQLGRFLESVGHRELAKAPSLEFINRAQPENFYASDLGDISNIVRLAHPDASSLKDFFVRLRQSGWLGTAYSETRSGQFCGSLMSFSNVVPIQLRGEIFIPEVVNRLSREADSLDIKEFRGIARFLCMLGAAYALWDNSMPDFPWNLPKGTDIRELYSSRAAKSANALSVGMYEIQFWLGLKYLACVGKNIQPQQIDRGFGASFIKRLKNTTPPTELAGKQKESLLSWLEI